MKKTFTISTISILFLILAACSINNEMVFYLISTKPVEGAKKIGCEEYLVPVKKSVFGKVTIESALNALFEAELKNLTTATAIKDKYLMLESVEMRKFGDNDGYLVSFKKNPDVGLAGVCDAPRLKEQITETVRSATGSKPFLIRVDGEPKNWECIGDESGKCS
ncbi:MAG: hypothetical protein AAB739_00425 [Patescibacteria group bacterium]